MKILQVGPNSVHVTRFINAFDSNKAVINFLLTDSPNLEAKVAQQFVVTAHSFNPIKIIGLLKIIQTILHQVDPTVIHIHQVNRLAFFTALVANWRKIPIVTTAWGSDVLIMPAKNKLYHYLVRKTLMRSNYITADAQDMIRAMQQLVPNAQYACLQYGITPIQAVVKQPIIYSNRLHKSLYNIDKVITYFADFHSNHPEWQLVIGATGSETDKLETQVKQLGLTENVQFIGWLNEEENRSLYAKASIYVSIPSSDGTSVSLLEAMSANCVPVVSDLPANKEWISHMENGIIVQSDNNPFEQALSLNQQQVSEINQPLITQRATRQSSMNQFFEIYLQLTHGK